MAHFLDKTLFYLGGRITEGHKVEIMLGIQRNNSARLQPVWRGGSGILKTQIETRPMQNTSPGGSLLLLSDPTMQSSFEMSSAGFLRYLSDCIHPVHQLRGHSAEILNLVKVLESSPADTSGVQRS